MFNEGRKQRNKRYFYAETPGNFTKKEPFFYKERQVIDYFLAKENFDGQVDWKIEGEEL